MRLRAKERLANFGRYSRSNAAPVVRCASRRGCDWPMEWPSIVLLLEPCSGALRLSPRVMLLSRRNYLTSGSP